MIKKYKIGDKVRVIKGNPCVKVGWEGVIEGEADHYDWIVDGSDSEHPHALMEDEIELIEEEFKFPKKFANRTFPNHVYTLREFHTMSGKFIRVSWDWEEHLGYRDYPTEQVEEYFVKGTWVAVEEQQVEENTSSVKSDGGSSSYYELAISNKEGVEIKVETGDVIRALVGNDFDFGNCVKALRRMYLATQGKGKEGVNVAYDANKIRYFLNEIERVNK